MALDRFRKHMRVPLPLVVEIQFDGEDTSHPFLMVDLSWGGMYIRSEKLKPVGTRLKAHLPVSEEKAVLFVTGTVVIQNKKIKGKTIPGMGISFDDIDNEAKSLIQKLIDHLLQSKA